MVKGTFEKKEQKTNLLGKFMSMTRDSKACRTGVAVEVVDVWTARSIKPLRRLHSREIGQLRTMLPNLCLNSAATLSQNARSSEPGGRK